MATKTPAAAPRTKPLSRRVLVNIHRDQTTATPRVVWHHEVPILEVIFGEGNVRQVLPETLDEGYTERPSPEMLVHNKRQDRVARPSESLGLDWVFIGDVEAEYQRLAACYGRHVEVNTPNVEYVYGRLSTGAFDRLIGTPTLDDLPDAQLRELITQAGYGPTQPTFQASAEERKAAAETWAAWLALTHDELVKLAEESGVEIGG